MRKFKNHPSTDQLESYDKYPCYDGNDLELVYTPEQSVFTLWRPSAKWLDETPGIWTKAVGINGNRNEAIVHLPEQDWIVVCKDGQIKLDNQEHLSGGDIAIAASSALILYRN